MAAHRTVQLRLSGKLVNIDVPLAALISELNLAGCETLFCCQGTLPGSSMDGYLVFSRIGAARLLRIWPNVIKDLSESKIIYKHERWPTPSGITLRWMPNNLNKLIQRFAEVLSREVS